MRVYFLVWIFLILVSCSNSIQLLDAPGVRQTVYRKQTDLLLTELHFPVTNNTNLDDLLRERILEKYRVFRRELDIDSIDYLSRGTAMIYRVTFDALRSPELKIISFIFYETQEVQDSDFGDDKIREGQNRNTEVEVFMYSLRNGSSVDFLDVIQDPMPVFQRLADSCLRQLNDSVEPGNFYSQEIQADREHLSMLSFGKSGIQVSFPPGQVMSSNQGVVNILVPWEEAIADRPWQYGITRNFRSPKYQKEKGSNDRF